VKPVEQAILAAAYRHAKRTAKGARRYDAALFFLECVYKDMRTRGHYVHAQAAYRSLMAVKRAGALMPVLEEFGLDINSLNVEQALPSPPPSNTGVTPRQLSMLEEFLHG
jgi:hypothetical protein